MKKRAAAKKAARKRARGKTGGAPAPKAQDEVDSLIAAAEAAAGDTENASPPTHEELQEILDAGVLGTYIDGQPSVCGAVLRPITASCMAILKQIGSGLVAGLKIDEIDNMALHGARFVVLWRDTGDGSEESNREQLREARRLIQPDNLDELDELAYEWLDTIAPTDIAEITNQSIFALRDALSTQVEPIPRDDDPDDDEEGEEEVEGND